MSEPLPLDQVRTNWGPFLDRIENGTTVLVQPAGKDSPTIVGLPPDLYDAYHTALDLKPAKPLELTRISSKGYRVDWTKVPPNAKVISLDSRAARSAWGTVHLRVQRGLHVIVLRRHPVPARRVAVFVPPAFAEQATAALNARRG